MANIDTTKGNSGEPREGERTPGVDLSQAKMPRDSHITNGRWERVGNHVAFRGTICVNGEFFEILFSTGSLGLTKDQQRALAQSEGFDLAPRRVSDAVACSIFDTDTEGGEMTIDSLRETYQKSGHVRDEDGIIVVRELSCYRDEDMFSDSGFNDTAALFARPSRGSE